jgi:hypothetical protein
MNTIFDVLRQLVKHFGAGEDHDRALEIIDAAEHPAEPAGPAAADAAPSAAADPPVTGDPQGPPPGGSQL